MFSRTALNLLAVGSVLTNRTLIAARLRAEPAAWRRLVGIGLRFEPSKFALSAFGLQIPPSSAGSENHLAARLREFLQTDPETRYRLDHAGWVTTRQPVVYADVVVQRFHREGALEAIEPHLSPGLPDPVGEADRASAHRTVVDAYNRTCQLPEDVRPRVLWGEVRRGLTANARAYAARLLAACCVSFEPIDAARRFTPPEFRARRGLGFGVFTFVVRPDPAGTTADVWALAHHTGADGVPLQEMMTRLEQSWGTVPVSFPGPDDLRAVEARACHLPGEREVYESVSVHDFTPLLRLRKQLNARFVADVGGDVPFAAVLLWCLAREPEFAGTKFANTVDVPALGSHERDVALLPLRPADFGTGETGLAAYARAFVRGVEDTRARRSPVQKVVRDSALIPAWAYRKILEKNPAAVEETFGSVGLSVIREGRVFVAPLSDVGFPGGFIAVGGVGLPTAGGRPVGVVSIKGNREQVTTYPRVLRRVLERCEHDPPEPTV